MNKTDEKLINKIRKLLDSVESYSCRREQYDRLLAKLFSKNQWQYYKDQFPLANTKGEMKIVKVLKYGEPIGEEK